MHLFHDFLEANKNVKLTGADIISTYYQYSALTRICDMPVTKLSKAVFCL